VEAASKSLVDFAIQALAHASSLNNIPALAQRGAVSFELFLGGGPDPLITRERAMQNSLFAAVAAAGALMGLYADDPTCRPSSIAEETRKRSVERIPPKSKPAR